jgi:L-threonylcarbamoyladenylate synthase
MIRLLADERGIARAASLVRDGRVVIWPSGGVYGLATSALSGEGIARIYAVKGRPTDKPLQVITSPEEAGDLGVLSAALESVIKDVWPGHVGFVVRRKSPALERVAGPNDTVLLVCPNWVARVLSRAAGVPVVGTSANRSGGPEITKPEEAEGQFVETVDALIDGGQQTGTLNTLIDVSSSPYHVLRKGGVAAEAILAMLAERRQK